MDDAEIFANQVHECVDRMQQSGAAGLAGLFDLTCNRLVRLAVAITRNQDDAEDAVQNALVRVADHPGLLYRTEQPWHYLLRMVRNESLLILRRKRRSYLLTSLSDLQTYVPVDEIEQAETYRAVWSALRKLPVRQSEVIVLKVWEGLTFAEIGEILEVSSSTVASRYRYGMEKLSRTLTHRSWSVT